MRVDDQESYCARSGDELLLITVVTEFESRVRDLTDHRNCARMVPNDAR